MSSQHWEGCWANKSSIDFEKAFKTVLRVLRSFGRKIGPKEEKVVKESLMMVPNISLHPEVRIRLF